MRRYRLEEYTQYDKRNDEIKIVKTKKTMQNCAFWTFSIPYSSDNFIQQDYNNLNLRISQWRSNAIKISLENTSHKMSEACFLYDKTLTKIQKNGKLCWFYPSDMYNIG